jgi:putative transposase
MTLGLAHALGMGRESEVVWRAVLDDMIVRGLEKPELAIVDGAPGFEKAPVALCSDLLMQRCTIHELRKLIADAS